MIKTNCTDFNQQHKWFEIKKLSKVSLKEYKRREDRKPASAFETYMDFDDLQGILIMCANCETQKELWEKEVLDEF